MRYSNKPEVINVRQMMMEAENVLVKSLNMIYPQHTQKTIQAMVKEIIPLLNERLNFKIGVYTIKSRGLYSCINLNPKQCQCCKGLTFEPDCHYPNMCREYSPTYLYLDEIVEEAASQGVDHEIVEWIGAMR